jgi:hypothetical protein
VPFLLIAQKSLTILNKVGLGEREEGRGKREEGGRREFLGSICS